jgi:hypothetical protein
LELTIGLEAILLPLFHSEYFYSNLIGVDVIPPWHIADMSRRRSIKLLTLNYFSFVMALVVMFAMFAIAALSGLTGSGLYAKERNTPSIAGALTVCLFYFEE